MRALLESGPGLKAFEEHINNDLEVPTEVRTSLVHLLAMQDLAVLSDSADRVEVAKAIVREHFVDGDFNGVADDALPLVLKEREQSYIKCLATTCVPSFLRSHASDKIVSYVDIGSLRAFAASSHLRWDQYKVEPDAAGWLFSIVTAVESMPIAVAISDARIAGNPLVYVNQTFCKMTGYSKSEAQGRNCRFLQGPETEVASISAIVNALRHGADCAVKLTNYRRSGETFDNLVSLRPVHDSNGVYRFCVSIQCEFSTSRLLGREQLELQLSFAQLLPTELHVGELPHAARSTRRMPTSRAAPVCAAR